MHFGDQINYNLENPTQVLDLGWKLSEISGIAYHSQSDALYAVNDEEGKLFAIDKRNGNILANYDIGSKGDYEGLEIRGNSVFIVESKGTVTVFDLIKKEKIEKLKNNLTGKNDIEGIGLGPDSSLLLLCKGNSLSGDKLEDVKHIYQLSDHGDNPVRKYLGIDIKAGLNQIQRTVPSEGKWLDNIVMKDRISRFAPSGIATHPSTGEKYIVSARGSLLIVLDTNEEIRYVHLLNPTHHKQAEGITFDDDNRLYISNEGKNGSAKILIYDSI